MCVFSVCVCVCARARAIGLPGQPLRGVRDQCLLAGARASASDKRDAWMAVECGAERTEPDRRAGSCE